jgi:hypothetical protein
LAYNALLFRENFGNYDTLYLFVEGDYWYFANSLVYLFGCSLRDAGLYFFLPTGGIWPKYSDEDESVNHDDGQHGIVSPIFMNKVESIETKEAQKQLIYGTFAK